MRVLGLSVLLLAISSSAHAVVLSLGMPRDAVREFITSPDRITSFEYADPDGSRHVGQVWHYEKFTGFCAPDIHRCEVAFTADGRLGWQRDIGVKFLDLNSNWGTWGPN
jgi:hypothetical protein